MEPITCGLEIHQQLNTKKLFCECESLVQEKEPDFTIKRKLRAVVGESGEIDVSAAQQAMKGKTYTYECYDQNCCLIELDEEPPRNIRLEAVNAAIQAGKLLDARFVDEAQTMRKTVVDGSNTSGFQRTTLIAHNGKLLTKHGTVNIPTIIVEEDSARLIKEDSESTTFRLDRLGIPLLEISTGPDIHTPEQAQEVAEQLGLLLRSSPYAKRGLGTIRQDVNVSIPGGTRVEIKGAQDLKMLPKLIEVEASRQAKLLEIASTLKKKGVKDVLCQIHDLTIALKNTQSKILLNALTTGGAILGIKLSSFKGLLGLEVAPGKRLGTELSEHGKTAAGIGGLFHSDELPNYGITQQEVELVIKHLDIGTNDAFILVADKKEKAEKALYAVIARAQDALLGVPKEVRRANEDGTTTFLRRMPGAARMYPETDCLPISLTKELIDSVDVPELIEHKIGRYEKMGLAKDLAELCAKSDKTELFDEFVKSFKQLKPAYIAEVILTSERNIKRQFNIEINPSNEDYCELLLSVEHDKISKESVLDILKENKPINTVIHKYHVLSDSQLQIELKKIIDENKGKPYNALIGEAMKKLRGKASGQKIAEMLKRLTS
ncbi:Glu-tRNA(Gln) amidotransferase subunit GatE [Candidatus Woesearchaeota archaeon]|nr:Glu-tRNA(Gln) amidotransferase subunit GatE [Candidatus Woesearchaeota archaeon]